MYMQSHIFNMIDVNYVSFSVDFFPTVERDQMCKFYKERGLEVPKSGKVVISNLHYGKKFFFFF